MLLDIAYADTDGNFTLSDGTKGNPGCDCGEEDAIVKVNGSYYCYQGMIELERKVGIRIPRIKRLADLR